MKYDYIVYHLNFFIASSSRTGNHFRIGNGVKIDIKKLFNGIENSYQGINFLDSECILNIMYRIKDKTFIYTKRLKGKQLERIFNRIIKSKGTKCNIK